MYRDVRRSLFVFSFTVTLLLSQAAFAQDGQEDASTVHAWSKSLEHVLLLMTMHGVPKNTNEDNPVTILINHGYAVGFSAEYNQPLWAAYQVSKAKRDVDYERFPFFVDDVRLPVANRIGSETFGLNYDRGHLAPNAAINRQFAKLSQMETFLMSNILPQKADLNQGVWQKLEAKILSDYAGAKVGSVRANHVWVIVGPIFDGAPTFITRPNGMQIAVPTAFYCILVRPFRYPQEEPGNSQYLTFIFGQDTPRNASIGTQYVSSINAVESRTGLNFLPALSNLMESRIENEVAGSVW
jgi:endonuclease G